MRRTILITSLLLLAAACSGNKPKETSSSDPGAVISEVGDPRARARSHTELAAAYYQRGNLGIALDELRIATTADPSYAPAHNLLGLVHMDLGEENLAGQSFDRALSLAPGDGDINHNYGLFLCHTKREPDSIKYFMQAIKNPLYSTPARSYSAAGVCTLRTGQPKQAEDYFVRALRLQPDDPQALLNLGQIRYKQGRMDEARRLVAQYNKLDAGDAESLWLALRIERKSGQRVAEQSFANQLRRRFPGSPEYQALQRGNFD